MYEKVIIRYLGATEVFQIDTTVSNKKLLLINFIIINTNTVFESES